uniref:Immunoglobulin V-set domain-containing protein n=1 Tax=Gasterosteus aculeatus TaxID=69293 RepID=G3PZM2_GASAC
MICRILVIFILTSCVCGRVQWDKDVLREGRLRFHISRLQTNDAGRYSCSVFTSYGRNYKECLLNVTDLLGLFAAVKDRSEPDTSLRGDHLRRISLYCALGLAAAALLVISFSFYSLRCQKD